MLLVYHQMEYQQWVPGPQTLVTLCVMVRYNEHKCCNLFQATKFLLRACRITKIVLVYKKENTPLPLYSDL